MSNIDAGGLKATRVRIGLQGSTEKQICDIVKLNGQFEGAYHFPPDDEHNYWADVIEDGVKFYYRVGDTTVEIDKVERDKVVANPSLYYFSTALKLHNRIRMAREDCLRQRPNA